MEEELKPCPFCGGEAMYIYGDPGGPYPGGYPMIVCRRAETDDTLDHPEVVAQGGKCLTADEAKHKAIAIRIWNTRVADPRIAIFKALIEKMEVIHNNRDYLGVWELWHNHFGDYKGPQYETEFKAAKAALNENV